MTERAQASAPTSRPTVDRIDIQVPAPGAPDAATQGCRCSVLANAAYRDGAAEEPLIDPPCEIHTAPASTGREPARHPAAPRPQRDGREPDDRHPSGRAPSPHPRTTSTPVAGGGPGHDHRTSDEGPALADSAR